MRVVLDYGGVLVEHVDEREYAHVLDVASDRDPYPGWLAYYLFRAGFVRTEAEYVDLLVTLTGASEDACHAYIQRTWLDPEFPPVHRELLHELSDRYSLVLFSNMAKPWIEGVLERYDVIDAFDELVVSSELQRPKPHPKGYVRCMVDADEPVVMVSDEFNEDLLMADCLGMRTIWLQNDEEQPYREPDVTIEEFAALPAVLAEIQAAAD